MSRIISHQAEVERRHINGGSWFPDEQYSDCEYPDTGFSHFSYIYIRNNTRKIITPGPKSIAIKILTGHWGVNFTEALQITISIFKNVDIPEKSIKNAITCYMIMKKLSPHSLKTNINRLMVILMCDNPDFLLSEVISKYEGSC